jgi:hypothetical protein
MKQVESGYGNADFRVESKVPYLQSIFSIRNPKSEVISTPLLQYSTTPKECEGYSKLVTHRAGISLAQSE